MTDHHIVTPLDDPWFDEALCECGLSFSTGYEYAVHLIDTGVVVVPEIPPLSAI